MSDVLDRTTLEIIESVNTPDYPTVDWVVNPDLSPVSGIAVKYWKLTGDALSEMSQVEKDVVDASDLADYKQARFAEIDSCTSGLITGGFLYAGKMFSMSIASQSKMIGTHQIMNDQNLVYPIKWNTIDDNDCYSIVDAADLNSFYLTGVAKLREHLDSGTSLKDSIRAAADIAAVDVVVDGR